MRINLGCNWESGHTGGVRYTYVGPWSHTKLFVKDVMDTATVLQLRDTCNLVDEWHNQSPPTSVFDVCRHAYGRSIEFTTSRSD